MGWLGTTEYTVSCWFLAPGLSSMVGLCTGASILQVVTPETSTMKVESERLSVEDLGEHWTVSPSLRTISPRIIIMKMTAITKTHA